MKTSELPVVIIDAGPVGLAAASQLRERGLRPLVLEAGASAGAAVGRWEHVRMFSPWEFNLDRAAVRLLERSGWNPPDPAAYPTGGELVARYLQPLASSPELAPHIRFGARVTGVARHRRDLMKNDARETLPYLVRFRSGEEENEVLARAVIDASGTFDTPNPVGASGLPALGERAAGAHVFRGVPDVLGRDRQRYAGKRVLVVGSGHSAFNVLADLARRATRDSAPIEWAVRRPSLQRVLGGGENDALKERGRLGMHIAQLVNSGTVRLHSGIQLDRIEQGADGLVAWSGDTALPAVDEIVASTGFRPDLSLLSEVRLDLDAGTQSPSALAPLIDPNLHSCGTVRPHGALELRHPDSDLYIAGMKSYGRAPTFLLLTGYEQVRSIAAAIDGDWTAASRVELVLPETGVCSTSFGDAEDSSRPASATCCGTQPATADANATGTVSAGDRSATLAAGLHAPASSSQCCGGAPPEGIDACCLRDADAKAAGGTGCGCTAASPASAQPPAPLAVAALAPALERVHGGACCGRRAA